MSEIRRRSLETQAPPDRIEYRLSSGDVVPGVPGYLTLLIASRTTSTSFG